MKKTNIVRLIGAGIIASIVFLIIEFFFEGAIKLIFNFSEIDMAKQYFPNIIVGGTGYQIVNFLYLACTCTVTIWLYVSLTPKFGDGLKTALIASLFVIIIIVLFMINHVNMGIFSSKAASISLVFGLVEFPISIIGGATVYRTK